MLKRVLSPITDIPKEKDLDFYAVIELAFYKNAIFSWEK